MVQKTRGFRVALTAFGFALIIYLGIVYHHRHVVVVPVLQRAGALQEGPNLSRVKPHVQALHALGSNRRTYKGDASHKKPNIIKLDRPSDTVTSRYVSSFSEYHHRQVVMVPVLQRAGALQEVPNFSRVRPHVQAHGSNTRKYKGDISHKKLNITKLDRLENDRPSDTVKSRKSLSSIVSTTPNPDQREKIATNPKSVTFNLKNGCQKVHFSVQKMTLTYLASFPGSGNTWVRHLLQQATGIYSSSVYHDPLLTSEEFKPRIFDGSATPIKIHMHADRIPWRMPSCPRAILILRNPLDAMKAEFNRRHAGKTEQVSNDNLKGWPSFSTQRSEKWLRHTLSWMVSYRDIFVIRYETLKSDLTNIVRQACDFLQLSTTDSIMDCVQTNQEGLYKRKKGGGPELLTVSLTMTRTLELYESYVEWYLKKRCPDLPACLPRSEVEFSNAPYNFTK